MMGDGGGGGGGSGMEGGPSAAREYNSARQSLEAGYTGATVGEKAGEFSTGQGGIEVGMEGGQRAANQYNAARQAVDYGVPGATMGVAPGEATPGPQGSEILSSRIEQEKKDLFDVAKTTGKIMTTATPLLGPLGVLAGLGYAGYKGLDTARSLATDLAMQEAAERDPTGRGLGYEGAEGGTGGTGGGWSGPSINDPTGYGLGPGNIGMGGDGGGEFGEINVPPTTPQVTPPEEPTEEPPPVDVTPYEPALPGGPESIEGRFRDRFGHFDVRQFEEGPYEVFAPELIGTGEKTQTRPLPEGLGEPAELGPVTPMPVIGETPRAPLPGGVATIGEPKTMTPEDLADYYGIPLEELVYIPEIFM